MTLPASLVCSKNTCLSGPCLEDANRGSDNHLPLGGSGTQKPGDEPEPFLEPNTAAGRHAGKDILDGSGLGPRVLVPLGIPCIFPAWCRPSTRPGWGRAVGENLEIEGLERTYKGGAGRAHMRPVPC